MSDSWSPDEPSGTERDEPWDEALDDEDELSPDDPDTPEGERELDRDLVVDQDELEELGAQLDVPERLAVLDGGMDDPDGLGSPGGEGDGNDEGWDLDASDRLTGQELDDQDEDDS